jgi:hypothetical protein
VRTIVPMILAVLFGGLVIVAPSAPATPPVPATTASPMPAEAKGGPPRRAAPPPRVERVSLRPVPTPAAFRAAQSYARARAGLVSFATLDSKGDLRGRAEDRLYPSASVVKSMLLAAELQRLAQAGEPVDAATGALLTAMITSSDNDAADQIYARVGDAGLQRVAEQAGMSSFTVAGHWGSAQITAADMALMFGDLDGVLAGPHRSYALGLLGSVVPEQSWGIPAAAGERWAVRFKGGWLPEYALAHQAAELSQRQGPRELSLAILTDAQPSHAYAVQTIRGVAERLLERR